MAANLFSVKAFGEFEFWFALIKVVTIILMIIAGFGLIFFGFEKWWPCGRYFRIYGQMADLCQMGNIVGFSCIINCNWFIPRCGN